MQFPSSISTSTLSVVSIVKAVAGQPLRAHLQCPFHHSKTTNTASKIYGILTTKENRIEHNRIEANWIQEGQALHWPVHFDHKWSNVQPLCSWHPHTIHASQTSTYLHHPGAFHSKKYNHHSQPSTYICYTSCFALLLCWTRLTGAPSILVELDSVLVTTWWVR